MRIRHLIRSVVPGAALIWALAGCSGDSATAPAVTPNLDYGFTWGTYTLVQTSVTSFAVSNTALIGPAGGRLRLGLHELVVPAGAVNNWTRFTMSTMYGHHVVVDLEAVDLRTGAEVRQFPVRLQLRLSYLLLLVPRSEVHKLTVLWMKDDRADGELVPMPTTVQPSQYYITGWLDHFSRFLVGMN
jgi:hypothetical protein